MTEIKGLTKEKKKPPTFGLSGALFGAFSAFCLALILKNTEAAVQYVTRGLLLCARAVIPSLFPFMVLSELIVSSGAAQRIPSPLVAPFRRLFGLPSAGVCAVLLGLLCGFPVGARCILSAYKAGYLSSDEAERALTCSSPPSSAFLIGAVGVSLWSNRRFGTALYCVVLAVSLLTGILANLLKKDKPPKPPLALPFQASPQVQSPAKQFCAAIASSVQGILSVCAYVVFFSAVTGTLNLVLGKYSVPQFFSAALGCVLEISGGISQASALGSPLHGAYLCAFAAGWSGLSVHCQMLSVCDKSGLSLRPYLLSKLLGGVLCALLFGILLSIFPQIMIPAEDAFFFFVRPF